MKMKLVEEEKEWNKVSKELEEEDLKLQSYDYTLIQMLDRGKNVKVLDYGAGPGVLATTLKKLKFDVKCYDLSKEMRERAGKKIGKENIYNEASEIPKNSFDYVVCNLVLCIVSEDECRNISRNISKALKENGIAYIGFCNPKIFNVYESALDFREQTENNYENNHSYMKIKKEGNYKILELHRPIEWHEKMFQENGLNVLDKIFTPEYSLKGNKIQDFIIFKLGKKEIMK